MTTLQVDSADPTPPFEQIRRQLVALIETGGLSSGERLPTVRQLAADLRVAPGTVSRTYKELEASGYVETRRAAGTRVRPRQRNVSDARLTRLADEYVTAAMGEDADASQILDAVHAAIARHAGSAAR